MKKILLLGCICMQCLMAGAQNFNSRFEKAEVKRVMQSVADWQIAHQKGVKHQALGWENAAMYLGMLDWAQLAQQLDNNDKYYKFLYNIGSKGGWQPAKRMYHADDICVAQMYIDLYKKYKKPEMLYPTFARTQWVMANPPENNMQLDYNTGKGLDQWTWCDALFMAPQVYVKLYMLTGDKKYMKFADKEYKNTYHFLYDQEEKLFFRDWRYFTQQEKNGRKVFWGRGNGWVLGGLAEILKELPANNKYRKFYEQLFVELAGSVLKCQQADGYWRASMLDPDSYPSPETSSTGFITYAFAYGVNEGILDAGQFMPAVQKGWKALVEAVEADGKLGYVQPIGADPRQVTREMTEVYGVGAFLMAGSEIYKMSE